MNMFELFVNKVSDEKIIEAIKKLKDINKDDYGRTLLHVACLFSRLKIVKFLIECGADINIKDYNGSAPLYNACFYNNTEVIKLLIECGADVDVKDYCGRTPLREACWRENFEIVKLLIEHGADAKSELERCFCPNKINRIKLLTKFGTCFI